MTMRTGRGGLTLVEVLIAAAIGLVVAAVALPMIQDARETARSTACRNNLKTIGLALHNYQETFGGAYPPGVVAGLTDGGKVGADGGATGWSWRVMLLPFLESTPHFDRIDFDRSYGDFDSATAAAIDFASPAWRCPADPRPVTEAVNSPTDPFANPAARTASYYGNAGAFEEPLTAADVPAVWRDKVVSNGLFGANNSVRIGDVRDGTSNTVITGEAVRGPASLYGTIAPGGGLLRKESGAVERTGDAGAAAGDVVLNAVMRTGEYRMNSPLPEARLLGFSSGHAGGGNFGMADGSVRFVSDTYPFRPRPGETDRGCDADPYDASADAEAVVNGRCGRGVYGRRITVCLPGSPKEASPEFAHMAANFGLYQSLFARRDGLR